LVSSILELSSPLPQPTQRAAAEYLALHLSIEDRDRLINILCRHNPDLTTPLVRAVVSAYEPVIRQIHQAVDLSAGLADLENFINDLIALAKPKDSEETAAGGGARIPVSGFVKLCEKHQSAMHRFLNQLAKNGGDLTILYKDWVTMVTRQFQISKKDQEPLKTLLNPLLQQLSESDRDLVMKEVDAHAEYLAQISSSSDDRARALVEATGPTGTSTPTRSKTPSRASTPTNIKAAFGIKPPSSPAPTSASHNTSTSSSQRAGPGVFLAKWQALLDNTEIGPTEDGVKKAADERLGPAKGVEKEARRAPSVDRTIQLLLTSFRDKVREVSAAENWTIA
jgi:hypothetical protein